MAKRQEITPKELAAISGKSDRTIARWCEKGKIKAFQMDEGGEWIIPLKTLDHIWMFKLDPNIWDLSVIVTPSDTK